ncbi:hypothetical protein VNI00_000671 [Paramarasmius palmivorus]|uniref:Uncharacterized protein n=1 Tax=Paramarasmius palmivorus TaxID=297713 RepID=A0AAW0E8E7_9AGAR
MQEVRRPSHANGHTPTETPYIQYASPEFIEPRPGPDYKRMAPSPLPPQSTTSYVSRVRTFIRDINALPWVASGPVTVDYVPRNATDPYDRHRPIIYWESPSERQNIAVDLTAGESTPSTASLAAPYSQGHFTNEGQSWPVVIVSPPKAQEPQPSSDVSFSSNTDVPRAEGVLVPPSPPNRWSPPREGTWRDEEPTGELLPTWAIASSSRPRSPQVLGDPTFTHGGSEEDGHVLDPLTPNTQPPSFLPSPESSHVDPAPSPSLSPTSSEPFTSNHRRRRFKPGKPKPGDSPTSQPRQPPPPPLIAPQPRRNIPERRWRLSNLLPGRQSKAKPNTMGLAIIDAIENDSDSDLDVEKEKARAQAKRELEERDLQYAQAVAMGLDDGEGDGDWEQVDAPSELSTPSAIHLLQGREDAATYAHHSIPDTQPHPDRIYLSPINLASHSGLHNDARIAPGSPYLNPHHPYSGYVSAQPPPIDIYGPAVHTGHMGYVNSRSASALIPNQSGRTSRASGSRPPTREGIQPSRLFPPPGFTDMPVNQVGTYGEWSTTSGSSSGNSRARSTPPVTGGFAPMSAPNRTPVSAPLWPPPGFYPAPQAGAYYQYGQLDPAYMDPMYPYLVARFG